MHQETTCKACSHQFTGKYCSNCGEKVYTDHDKSVAHFFEEGLHFITHFEGTLFTTVKTLFSKPGQLSVDYCSGVRKKYFKPLSFFLLLVVLYLLFPLFEGLNMRLAYHLQNPLYGSYAGEKVKGMLAQHRLSASELETAFHQKSEKVSKFLLLIIIPVTALFLWAVSFRKRRLFFDQMVFSAELNSVYLLWGFLLLPVLTLLFEVVVHLLTTHYLPFNDDFTALLIGIPLGLYTFFAAKKFYGLVAWQALLMAVYFLVENNLVIHFIYKAILFFIAIHMVHE